MNYFIGIDGGGTGSTCVIADSSGKILYRCKGGPTNFLRYDVNSVCKTIHGLITKCVKKLKISFSDIGGMVIGTAGAGREKDAGLLRRQLKKLLKSEDSDIKNIRVVSDGVIALEGAFPGSAGCILISGTGSVIFGKNKNGEIFRAGGFGNKIGDEGSGYSIGRAGLNAVSKYFDGRGDKTLLAGYLQKQFKINSGSELIDKVYGKNFDIASFAPMVIKAAGRRDLVSVKILHEESTELLLHLKALRKISGTRKLKVVLGGSLLKNRNYYSGLIRKKIGQSAGFAEIVKPANSPEAGAALLALKIFGA